MSPPTRSADPTPAPTSGSPSGLAGVLARHGYPPMTRGADLLRLQRAQFTLIH